MGATHLVLVERRFRQDGHGPVAGARRVVLPKHDARQLPVDVLLGQLERARRRLLAQHADERARDAHAVRHARPPAGRVLVEHMQRGGRGDAQHVRGHAVQPVGAVATGAPRTLPQAPAEVPQMLLAKQADELPADGPHPHGTVEAGRQQILGAADRAVVDAVDAAHVRAQRRQQVRLARYVRVLHVREDAGELVELFEAGHPAQQRVTQPDARPLQVLGDAAPTAGEGVVAHVPHLHPSSRYSHRRLPPGAGFMNRRKQS